jgi:DNA-nicking Smr family endonuclease
MTGKRPAPDSKRTLGCRKLTADEEHLWSAVACTVKPLRHARKAAHVPKHKAAVAPEPHSDKTKVVVEPIAAVARIPAAAPGPPTAIARREKQQLARGRAAIDGRIDLHGMTLAKAHSALLEFLRRSQLSGAKFVLIITGKGAPSAPRGERGVLRRQVPLWLALPEFRGCVLGFDVAHVGHGGEGALYVRLRKPRR